MNAIIEKLTVGEGRTETFKAFAKGWSRQTPMITENIPTRDGVECDGFGSGLIKQEFENGRLVRVIWVLDQ